MICRRKSEIAIHAWTLRQYKYRTRRMIATHCLPGLVHRISSYHPEASTTDRRWANVDYEDILHHNTRQRKSGDSEPDATTGRRSTPNVIRVHATTASTKYSWTASTYGYQQRMGGSGSSYLLTRNKNIDIDSYSRPPEI